MHEFRDKFPAFYRTAVAVNLRSWRDCCARGFFLGSAKGEPLIQETTYRTCLPESLQIRRLVPEADPGEGPRGGAQRGRPLPQPLFLEQSEARRAEKNFFENPFRSLISGSGSPGAPLAEGLDAPLSSQSFNE